MTKAKKKLRAAFSVVEKHPMKVERILPCGLCGQEWGTNLACKVCAPIAKWLRRWFGKKKKRLYKKRTRKE